MSKKYKFADNDKLYFVSFAVTNRIDLSIRNETGNPLQNIMRDLKRHTAEVLHQSIQNHPTESRREWMLWMIERAAKKTVAVQNSNCGNQKAIQYN